MGGMTWHSRAAGLILVQVLHLSAPRSSSVSGAGPCSSHNFVLRIKQDHASVSALRRKTTEPRKRIGFDGGIIRGRLGKRSPTITRMIVLNESVQSCTKDVYRVPNLRQALFPALEEPRRTRQVPDSQGLLTKDGGVGGGQLSLPTMSVF